METPSKAKKMIRSFRTADDMPIEWIAQILSFLSLAERFVCKSVSRKWFFAANQSITDQETVTLAFDPVPGITDRSDLLVLVREGRAAPPQPAGDSLLEFWNQQEQNAHLNHLIKSLSSLKNLEKITTNCSFDCDRLYESSIFQRHIQPYMLQLGSAAGILNPLILYNAKPLTCLILPDMDLPHDSRNSVTTYPRLKTLTCRRLAADVSYSCPRLRKLKIDYAENLDQLDAPALHELSSKGDINPESISNFESLKKLTVGMSGDNFFLSSASPENVMKLVNRISELKVLSLTCSFRMFDQHDHMIRKVVQNNPALTELSLNFMSWSENNPLLGVSEAGMKSIAGLQHLEKIHISCQDGSETIALLLILLRGDSRHTLKQIKVRGWKPEDSGDEQLVLVRAELASMSQETGFLYQIDHVSDQPAFFSDNIITINRHAL
jgi:hypothetical protein